MSFERLSTMIFMVVLAGLVIWQLVTGKAFASRSWRDTIDRDDEPGKYWLIVGVQCLLLVIVAITGRTHWEWTSDPRPSRPRGESSEMSPLMGVLFASLAVMVIAWFISLRKFVRHMRDQHPEKYDAMHLDAMFSQDNARAVYALGRFLARRQDAELQDAALSRLSSFMRLLFCAFLALFLVFFASVAFQVFRPHPGVSRKAPVEIAQARASREKAYQLHNEAKWNEAITVYNELLQQTEKDAELHYWRGVALHQVGRTESALVDYRRTIELEPTNFDAHLNADRILSRYQRWGEILDMWDRYIARVPTNADAYFERGGTNYRSGNLAAARADAGKACGLGKVEACRIAERLKTDKQ